MLDKRYVKNGGVEMAIKVTPPAAVGFLSMGRRMSNRTTKKQTHFKEYGKAVLEAGVDWDLIANRVYELAITTDAPNEQIRIEISFDGKVSVNDLFSQGGDPALAEVRVTTRKGG